MRAAIILAGLLVASSAVAAGDAFQDGSLEKFGATGLPQADAPVKAPAVRTTKVVSRVTKETQVAEGSLERFGATGLGQ
jgi:hypothetical protein